MAAAISGLGAGLVVHRQRLVRAVDEQQQLRDDLRHWEHRATHDSLTGLLNRTAVLASIEQRLVSGSNFAVLFCDIDRFKAFNDGFGHHAGDMLIAEVASRLEGLADGSVVVARLGGDEFVVVIDSERSDVFARAIIGVMNAPCAVDDRLVRVSLSVGLAKGPWNSNSPTDVLAAADGAMRTAKHKGGDCIELTTGDAQIGEAHRRESRIRRAIADDSTIAFFQPEVDVERRLLVGAEVLARWKADDGSLMEAGEYLQTVVDAHSYERLTESAVRRAQPLIDSVLSSAVGAGFRFRINLPQHCAPRAWRDGRIVQMFGRGSLEWLAIDLHTSAVVDDLAAACTALDELRARGALVSIVDVFSVDPTVLDRITIDDVRVDARTIDSTRPSDHLHVTSARILAERLGVSLSAVCVETLEQSRELVSMGCVRQQGRFFHHEVGADEFEDLLSVDSTKRIFDRQMA